MKYRFLLTAVAVPALMVATPAAAQATDDGPQESGSILYTGYINIGETGMENIYDFESETELEGHLGLSGEIEADSAAHAGNSNQQTLDSLDVDASGNNSTLPFDISGSGNIGVNIAAGAFNQQANSAAMAISNDSDANASGGWSHASTASNQTLGNLSVSSNSSSGEEDDDDEGGDGAGAATSGTNSLIAGSISGSGNIGVNVAAGAFNQQANLMTLAVATDSVLAQATAGIVQNASDSSTGNPTGDNSVSGLTLDGVSGNVGVNLAAGVGNQQVNSLTIASSSTGPAGGTGGGGGGDQ